MSLFRLSYEIKELQLKHVFTISRGSKASVKNVFLQLSKDEIVGFGEAAPNKRYRETAGLVAEELAQFDVSILDNVVTPDEVERVLRRLAISPSTKVAIEMAWLDWWAKKSKQPLWKLMGFAKHRTPMTSYTIGIDSLDVIRKKVLDAEEFPILKVKLGTDYDREIIETIRSVTNKPIRVDANEGWVSLPKAEKEIDFLSKQNIEMIEQPMPSSMIEEMKELKKISSIPLCADESFIGNEGLNEISEAFHCINIKLMKIGSVVKAIRTVKEAHELGLKVMVGCMVESSLAISAGALVGLEADYVDLDGHLLIVNDIYEGLKISNDQELLLSDKAGWGLDRL